MEYSAMEIAHYIINKCTVEKKAISNLQLQKILYYIQIYFVKNTESFFCDEIEAWQFGPVVPVVYYQYCGFGAMPITMRYDIKNSMFKDDVLSTLDSIITEKRIKDPWVLVEETHKPGGAWDKTYCNGLGNGSVIPLQRIKIFE